MTPQNMPRWCIDYFELNLLERQAVQEGRSDSASSSRKQEINPPCERYLLRTKGRRTSFQTGLENLGLRKLCKQTLLLPNVLLQAQTSLSCQSSQIYCFFVY